MYRAEHDRYPSRSADPGVCGKHSEIDLGLKSISPQEKFAVLRIMHGLSKQFFELDRYCVREEFENDRKGPDNHFFHSIPSSDEDRVSVQ